MKAARAAAASAVLLLTAAVAGCTGSAGLAWSQGGSEQTSSGLPASLLQPGRGVPVGVYEEGFPRTPDLIATFASATGVHPRLTEYYSGWNERFRTSFADASRNSGATLVVQLQPNNVPLTAITAGHWDAYLRSYAAEVRAYGHPVILSFGREMNGTWYSWASGHATPAQFVAAWRHVVTIFRQQGASNVSWLWTVTAVGGSGMSGPGLGEWWPGAPWVSVVGVDGYYYRASDTFSSVFEPALEQIRAFTKAPVIISEVGIGPNSNRENQIRALFPGVKASRISAVIWFDADQHDGLYHQDWQLEGHPEALSAFRAAAAAR